MSFQTASAIRLLLERGSSFGVTIVVTTVATFASYSHAQCDGAYGASFGQPGLFRTATQPPTVLASTLWDPDGPGPQAARLVIGGAFTTVNGVAAANIAQWDGSVWAPLATGVNGPVLALRSVPNASGGNDLLVGGSFSAAGSVATTGIARWNTQNWSVVGNSIPAGMGGAQVRSIDRLSNGRIVICGRWGSSLANVATLSEAGTWQGLASLSAAPNVIAVASNGELYAGGPSFTIGGTSAGGIARWDGAAWTRVGSGVNGSVSVITPLADGRIVVGGLFPDFFGFGAANNIAIWNPSTTGPNPPGWSELANGVAGEVKSIIALSDGGLLVGGAFSSAGVGMGAVQVDGVARFNDNSWRSTGLGVRNTPAPAARTVSALTQLANSDVFIGGVFDVAGGVNANAITLWTPPIAAAFQTPPAPVQICPSGSAVISSVAAADTQSYFWEYRNATTLGNWWPVDDGPNQFFGTYVFDAEGSGTSVLTLTRTEGPWTDNAEFRLTIDNGCDTLTSQPASLTVINCCPSDIAGPNQSVGPDGFLTADDIIVYLGWFFADDLRADVAGQNQSTTPDGTFTADDIIVFLNRYFAGC